MKPELNLLNVRIMRDRIVFKYSNYFLQSQEFTVINQVYLEAIETFRTSNETIESKKRLCCNFLPLFKAALSRFNVELNSFL